MNDTDLVIAARAGDRAALDELIRRYLPMVYNLAWRAMGRAADVDDVVQEVMLRVLRQLPGLREPHSFRPWLAAIAVRQVSTHLAQREAAAHRVTGLEEVANRPDPAAEVEDATALRAELAVQRRQVRHAARWLGTDDRVLLGLWWLETIGQLSRPDMAAALGISVSHAGVRVQRMREQLELSRSVVAALDAMPGCDRLGAVIADWNGAPSPFWRKRIARHVRSCTVCTRAVEGSVPVEALLAGLALLPVPVILAATIIAKGALVGKATGAALAAGGAAAAGNAAKGGMLAGLVQATMAHPVVAAVTAGTVALGVAVPTTGLSATPPWAKSGPPATSPAGPATSPGSGPLKVGSVSLESANVGGRYITVSGDRTVLAEVGAGSDPATRRRATLEAVPGLADPACFSFRVADGRYLRHASWRLMLGRPDGTNLFRGDATFCPRAGSTATSISLESANFRGRFVRHVGPALWIDPDDGRAAFRADSAFLVRAPLA
jgi:RNA polymerase sigma factor (sigma-70 family)